MEKSDNYEEELSVISDETLKEILINRYIYDGRLVNCARKELGKRKVSLTADELRQAEENKKKRIREVQENADIKIRENWYTYEDCKLKEINIVFKDLPYFNRIKRSLLIICVYILVIAAVVILKEPAILRLHFNSNFKVIVILFIILILARNLIVSLYRNHNYLLKIHADHKGISLKYLINDTISDFYSSWYEIEIKKKHLQVSKNNDLILLLKFQNKTLLRILEDVNHALDREHLHELIINLKTLKDASQSL
jgi:hypothetical protein